MNKAEKIAAFNSNAPSDNSENIFGLPFSVHDAKIVIIPVPWEVTVSYKTGTANAPQAVLDASFQVDLFDPYVKDAWQIGLAMEAITNELKVKNEELRIEVEKNKSNFIRNEVNKGGNELNIWLKEKSLNYLNKGKLVATLGGDHSTPLGLIQALAKKHSAFGMLQIDAHFDLRKAYEGYEFSHASIMYNALKLPQISKLVSVGIRDYCEEEVEFIEQNSESVIPFYWHEIQKQKFNGKNWASICAEIIEQLPENVYISFDIDGLDPKLCPNTGTPVPGGLEFDETLFLIHQLVESGRKIIGFDLSEVGNSKWDGNVGARLLYRVCNLMAKSNIIGD